MLIIRKEQFDAFKIPFRKKARANILHNIQGKEFHKVYEEGRSIVVEDSKGKQTTLHFAENFLPEKITKPSNTQYKLAFDEDDRLTNFGFAGNEESLRLIYEKELLKNILLNDDIVTINYDDEQRIAEIVYPDNKSVRFTYNQNNELIALTNRAGETKQFGTAYRNGKFIYSIRDSLGRDTLFERNDEGNIDKIVFPDGNTEETTFNEDIGAEITTLRNGAQRITYYEGLYPSRIEYDDGSFVNLEVKENGQVESIENETGTISYEYDKEGKLLSESFQDQKVKYNYDADNLLADIVYPSGFNVKYGYDEDGRLKTIQADGQVVEYKYAGNDTVSEIKYPNGLTEIQRNKIVGGLQESKIVSRKGETLSRQHYSYDNLTRLTEYLDQNQEAETKQWQFAYDDDSRLLSSEDIISQRKESFKHDRKGNFSEINQQQVVVGRMDELRSIGNSTIQYDDNGNVSSFINEQGRRVALKFSDSGVLKFAKIEDDEWEYWYDGLGRRIAKSNGNQTYKYHWASEKLLSEEYNKKGNEVALREYIYSPYSNVPIAFRENSKFFWLHRDVRGAITCAYDEHGETIWSVSYSAFGAAQISIEKIRQPWRLMGQYFDDETRLHYNFARYYSPTLRSYLSIDPRWNLDEATNFSYSRNDPYNRADATGNIAPLLAALGLAVACAAITGALIGGAIGGIASAIAGEGASGIGRGIMKGAIEGGFMGVGAVTGGALGALTGNPIGIAAGVIAGETAGAAAGAFISTVVDQKLFEDKVCIPCARQAAKEAAIWTAGIGVLTLGIGGLFSIAARKIGPKAAEAFPKIANTLTKIEVNLKIKGLTTKTGVKISGSTNHAAERAVERGISGNSIKDALENPLKVSEVKYDSLGRPSQRFTGSEAEVAINPETGQVVSVNPTSSKKAAKLLQQNKN